MRKEREQANILRRSGLSYSEISSRMSVPRSTLSSWFKSQDWSNGIALKNIKKAGEGAAMRLMVLNTVRGNRLKKVYEDARQDAMIDFAELKYHPLFLTGIILYWCHGNKSSEHNISLSSSDARVIKIFKLFLDRICSISEPKVSLLLKKGQNEDEAKLFWIEKCGLKSSQFRKSSFIKPVVSRVFVKKLENKGICNIGLTSAYLKNKILKWIELASVEISEEKYYSKETENGEL